MSAAICGYMRWRSLLFLHWKVPVAELERVIPSGLELDLHDGVAYVTLLPFAMEGVRPVYVPEFLSVETLETNVRTYVRSPGGTSGIYFFSLDAESIRAVAGGRIGFGLPYHLARMRLKDGDSIEYVAERRSGTRPRLRVAYRVGDRVPDPVPGSLDHFLVERYVLFARRGRRLLSCRVRHPPYVIHTAQVLSLEDELVGASGIPEPRRAPDRVHWSPGVDVEVEWPRLAR